MDDKEGRVEDFEGGRGFDYRTFPYKSTIGVPLKTSRDQREIGSGEDEEAENVLNVEVK